MKYINLFESYKSQKEIEKLANDIIKKCAERTYNEIEITNKNSNVYIERPIEKLMPVYFKSHFKEDEINKYTILNKFIRESGTGIGFITPTKNNPKGSFENGYWGRAIKIYYDEWLIDELNDEYITFKKHNIDTYIGAYGKTYNAESIYFSIYSKDMEKTLMHELTHSYDDWRSNGKALKQSDKYNKNSTRKNELKNKEKNGNKLTDEEKKFLDKQRKEYLNLKHEIDARFAHTLRDVNLITMNTDNKKVSEWKYYLVNWEIFYKDFKLHFEGWNDMTDKDKKRLNRRLSQFYELEKEEVIKKNIEHKNNK
jgi:hypothetical protein